MRKPAQNQREHTPNTGYGLLYTLSRLHDGLVSLVLVPVQLYRRFLSPLKGQGSCRFTPTCSQYCIEAVREWGILIGLALTAWRILRCNPFGKGGYDPVPKRKKGGS